MNPPQHFSQPVLKADLSRCPWAAGSALYRTYHDTEWGVPVHDDRLLFEFLILEGAQAGLSWSTILQKRAGYRRAFSRFDAGKIAQYDERKITALLADEGIVRNRLKIHAAVKNARAILSVRKEYGSFDSYIWSFVDGAPIVNAWKSMKEVPASTPVSEALSRDLRARGCTFVGPTICYALMQAIGLVNDHLVSCFRHKQLR